MFNFFEYRFTFSVAQPCCSDSLSAEDIKIFNVFPTFIYPASVEILIYESRIYCLIMPVFYKAWLFFITFAAAYVIGKFGMIYHHVAPFVNKHAGEWWRFYDYYSGEELILFLPCRTVCSSEKIDQSSFRPLFSALEQPLRVYVVIDESFPYPLPFST